MAIIKLQDIWLKYKIEFKESGRLTHEDFWGLKNINIEVVQGETVGIIGENGAGKSTLLRVVGGMLKPERGSIETRGRIAGLVDLGGGFQKDLTGSENIFLIFSLFGLTRKQAQERYEDVVRFAAIGRFINAPVKCYSQGMLMRLGFAIAIHADPDIFLLDDSFVVGDMYAQNKCINKLFEMRQRGKTILLVSHDLSIAKRMCSRGIFLREGMLIKDGSINAVCDYYSETVGDKNGIAIIEEGKSGAIFNNGKLIIRWKDSAITIEKAGHSVMAIAGRDYASTFAEWQIEKVNGPDGRGIIATGSWADIPVKERWKVLFLNEGELVWETRLESPDGSFPERYETNIILQEGYKDWFTVNGEKPFSKVFLHGEDWQCEPVEDSFNAVVGLRGDSAGDNPPPVIIFDRLSNNQQAKCHIGNSGSVVNGRVLRYTIFPRGADSAGPHLKRNIFYSRIMLIDPAQKERIAEFLDKSRELMRDSIFINRGALSVICRDHEIGIYWNGRLITRNSGFNTQFKYRDRNYSAADGNWSISKDNESEISVAVCWDEIRGLRQNWNIGFKDDNTIALEVTFDTDEECKIINRQAHLILSSEYSGWFTAVETGQFNRIEKRGGAVILEKYANNYVGVEGLSDKEEYLLPEVSFSYDGGIPAVSYISKDSGEISPGVKLQFLEIDTKDRSLTSPGKNGYFKGTIRVAGSFVPRAEEKTFKKKFPVRGDGDLRMISHGRLAFIIDHGKGRIIWDGLELTKGLGLYSSGFLHERWHDSSQAYWQVSGTQANKIVAVGHWPWVTMKQVWEIGIPDERTITIKFSREIWDDGTPAIEREQVGLMVSDNYKEWFSPRQTRAKFPPDFIEHNGAFWERLWCGEGNSCIGVEKSLLKKSLFKRIFIPSLRFESLPDCRTRQAIVENTDDLFRARVMQYEIPARPGKGSGAGVYFLGRIKITG